MPDINWDGDSSTARYVSEIDDTSGNFVLARDQDNSIVLLEYDGSSWQSRGPVEMNGGDVSGVGALDAESVSTEQQVSMASEPFTLYVRSDGDDSNTGLTESDAVSSVKTALTRIPRIGVQNSRVHSAIINLEAGSTFSTNYLTMRMPWASIEFQSSQDGTPATIELSNDAFGMDIRNTDVAFRYVHVVPSDPANPYTAAIEATKGSAIRFEQGTEIHSGDTEVVFVGTGSVLSMQGGVVDGQNTADACVVANQFAYSAISGGTLQNATANGYILDDVAGGTLAGTISNCPTAVKTQDNGRMKAQNGTIDNCTTAFKPTEGGTIKRNNTTLTSVTNELPDTFEGSYHDLDNSRYILNGIEEYAIGTETVPAGGSMRVSPFARVPGGEVFDWQFGVNSTTTGTVQVKASEYYDSGNDRTALFLEEVLGNADAEVSFTIWVNHRP